MRIELRRKSKTVSMKCMEEKKCDNCVYYDVPFCKRYPPCFYIGKNGRSADFPYVSGFDWCGEFVKKEQ